MNKLMVIMALGLMLGTGAASAAATGTDGQPVSRMQVAQLNRQLVFSVSPAASTPRTAHSASIYVPQSPYGNANSGMPNVPGAPSATAVNGGGAN